jgi:hypothetical protein
MNLRVIPNNKLYYVIKERAQPEIKRVMSPYQDKKIDFLALGFWVSSIVAAILAVPAIGVFVYFYAVFDNILGWRCACICLSFCAIIEIR